MKNQTTLTGTYTRNYKKNGKDIFVYEITGNESSLAKYKETQGEFYRENEATGKALYFSVRFVGNKPQLIITDKGNVVPNMEEFNKAASLASQFGGNLGQELARNAASKLMGEQPTSETPAEPVNTQADPDLIEKQ